MTLQFNAEVIMGLFSQIFGSDRPDGLFRTEMQHTTNRVDQIAKNSERIEEIRDRGVSEVDYRILNVYFFTNTEKKAKALVSELAKVNYECTIEFPVDRNGDYVVSGRTAEIQMSDESIAEWTDLMCGLAAVHDCEFYTWELP